MICSILSGEDATGRTKASSTLLMAGLTHDLAEQKASDVSAPAKRLFGQDFRDKLHEVEQLSLREYGLDYEQYLTEEEKVILQFADCFDGLLYCCREIALGNKNAMLIWRRFCRYIETIGSVQQVNIELSLRTSNVYEAIKAIHQEITSVGGPNFDLFS